MFLSFLGLLTAYAMTLEVISSLNSTDIDSVINYCQNIVEKLRASEVFYVKGERKVGEPVLFGPPFKELLRIVYGIDQRQKVFECISDTLDEKSKQNLATSDKYRTLVQNCMSKRPKVPRCDPSNPYRNINGTCNNLADPRQGSTLSCFRKLFPANYEGVSGMKRGLPDPRSLSRSINEARERPTRKFNTLFVFFGQAVAHDIGELSFSPIQEDKQLACCRFVGTKYQYPQCAPLTIQPDDLFYSRQNISCLNFVRMAACYSCSTEKREHINQVTSYIDCSIVYSQTEERSKTLRRNDGTGKLLSQQYEFEEFMPGIEQSGGRCGNAEEQQYCFQGGDDRTNQHSMLMMLQTLFLREHNRIAAELSILNVNWDEEKLFQESRRILIAETQTIIYKELLPVLVGSNLMSKYNLSIGSQSDYDSEIDPSISIEFDAAAYRIHTLVPGKVVYEEDIEYLRFLYINAVPLYNSRTSAFLTKMSDHPPEKYDRFMPTDLTHWLYREKYGTYGFDLAAVDIQRGRDVGLPTYIQVLEYLKNKPGAIQKFEDLEKYFDPECQGVLEKNYQNVRDIDLWVGLNCERVPDGMIISPTAAEIIAEQFHRLKFGDRFYFEHDRGLTRAQRLTIMNASLAKLICDNTEVNSIQPKAMLFSSTKNIPRFCSDIPGINLEKWKE